ncbi:peptidoglycan DD-metalloendopeptidase family protein [Streptomyces ficellus]|uniref:Peptidoglycan DD-metalloendopeptidase family protein n=1 Tax=Streptomyces ficellus TaxID=1977088 RepID=A0ABT7ZCD0_9ACTN|nr:peptidoglycan DD-metalloendopeptidase family protein [Streptomyces ficellus]MDN3296711.1 peptidoglycan DD-metalloendopeptidase family protein [Streptomyces ficellus]
MNDQHPHAGYVGDDAYSTGSFDTGSFATDPLFGALPGTYETVRESAHGTAYQTASYEGGYPGGYDAIHSGQYDTTQWTASTQQWDTTGYVEYSEYTGQWDASAWSEAAAQPAQAYDTTGQWDTAATAAFDTGAYDATAWNIATAPTETYAIPEQYDYAAAAEPADDPHADTDNEAGAEAGAESGTDSRSDTAAEPDATSQPVVPRPVRRSGGSGSRGRRRTPAKRSALLTVAVPSACVMGVAGIAAASVSGLSDSTGEAKSDAKAVTAADPASVQPVAANSQLDTQLAALSADARDFGDRASRTQERIDLKARQEAERKKREEEAARREAMRPKFVLPVKLHQLSAYYGQAGVNWMSLHTGIDFPVQYGTPVMAATDGTVRTQWNSAYGNMAIVTAKDGTETWYCHLSSTKIRSGEVKAGDVIAYSGNSGNSTGPHLHFEVRPGGGAAIDPLPWLRSHGVNPTG